VIELGVPITGLKVIPVREAPLPVTAAKLAAVTKPLNIPYCPEILVTSDPVVTCIDVHLITSGGGEKAWNPPCEEFKAGSNETIIILPV
jgi:hypothetical protein